MELRDAEHCWGHSGSWASHFIQNCFKGGEVGAVGGETDKAPQATLNTVYLKKRSPGVCVRG